MKYKLTDKFIKVDGKKLYRIEALKDFSVVTRGDLGGYVESEKNLSQMGEAWVYGSARVSDSARVYGEAWVYDSARVYGSACVSDSARVSKEAKNSPLFLAGGKLPYRMTVTDKHIRVGCQVQTLKKWKKNGISIIREDGHSEKNAKRWLKIILTLGAMHMESIK